MNTLSTGTIIKSDSGTYTIQKVLGQDAFSITYLALNCKKRTQVALTEFFIRDINERSGDAVIMDENDKKLYNQYAVDLARKIVRIDELYPQQPVATFTDYFKANNTIYYVIQMKNRESLDKYMERKGKLPETECLKIARQIGEALYYLHANHILHLNLKPSNILIDRKTGNATVTGFGLSKQCDEYGEPEMRTSIGNGTPGYAPIEQATYQESKKFSPTIDIYAMGAILFEMLTGERPPKASDILAEGYPAYKLQEAHVNDDLLGYIAKAMSVSVPDRYQTVEDFTKSFAPSMNTAVIIRPLSKTQQIIEELDSIKFGSIRVVPLVTGFLYWFSFLGILLPAISPVLEIFMPLFMILPLLISGFNLWYVIKSSRIKELTTSDKKYVYFAYICTTIVALAFFIATLYGLLSRL